MYNELLKPTEFLIKDKKKLFKGNVTRAAIFARSKVIEIITADNENFYFIYYKNTLIYGEKLDKVEKGTFINKAFHEGILFESPHPILTALIPNLSISIPNKNKLFSQLQTHFSLEEMAYIATTLDSFFEKDQLIGIIDKIFFHFRRDGNFIKSFQIIQILRDFSPILKSAKERFESLEFNSYRDYYHSSSLPLLLKRDPLFVEVYCFKNRFNPDERIFLEDILNKQDCLVELLLWLENVEQLQGEKKIEKYTEIALRFVTMEEWILILGLVKINPFRELPEALSIIEKMIQKGNYEKAAFSILSFIDDLPSSFDAPLSTIWENADSKFVISHLDAFIKWLQKLPYGVEQKQSEEKILQLAAILLEEHDVKTVHEKISPLQELFPHTEVIRKINEMVELLEDPDRMMELGDHYAEFNQFDKAIDCFSWEMELQPQNPAPVLKISKMYQNKGMSQEAATYQKIYVQLKSNQQTG
jgi:tetratricopeptide (TPR) repeat protein